MSKRAPFRTRLAVEGTTLRVRREQPNESEILQANRKLQQTPGGRGWSARVTDVQREVWKQQGREDLLRGDRRALEKFIDSPEGRKYATHPRGKSRSFSFGGL